MQFKLVQNDGTANITVFLDGEIYVANNDHPNYEKIVQAVLADDPKVVNLFDTERYVRLQFAVLSERITVRNGKVYLDGDEVHNALADQVITFLEEGEDFGPLVRFWEKLLANPNEHSREQTYRWLNTHKFTISPNGDIIGYKKVYLVGDGEYKSVSSGHAFSDGVEYHSQQIPQKVGSVVEMPRSEVTHDPRESCSYGLHIGNWSYVSSFSGNAILKILVNPRDVVSVPTDSGDGKMRVCRYKVLAQVTSPNEGPVDLEVTETVEPVKAEKADTRENYKRQARYPKGHPKAGQFIPKNSPDLLTF